MAVMILKTKNNRPMKAVIRRHPFWNDFPSVFDEMFNDWSGGSVRQSVPAVNIRETDNAFHLEVAVPGYDKGDFSVELDHDTLTISSETKHESESGKENYTRREFSYQSFKRSFQLPEKLVDGDKINAKYESGILKVELPKRVEAQTKPTRNIEIG